MSSITKTRISATLPAKVATELKRFSKEKNIPQSFVIAQALENWLSQKLANDAKELAKIEFDDLPSENEWIDLQPSF